MDKCAKADPGYLMTILLKIKSCYEIARLKSCYENIIIIHNEKSLSQGGRLFQMMLLFMKVLSVIIANLFD